MTMLKGCTLIKRDLYVVRWWLVAIVAVLCGDMAIRYLEGTQPTSEFWWGMLGRADEVTVPLALGCWVGLVVVLFQQDRLDGRAAFWQARPISVWRLLICRLFSLVVLLGGVWLFLSVVEGAWSLAWTLVPIALAGLAAAVSVLSPGWRRLAMGLVGVGVLIWIGFAAWPWLMRLLGPQIGFVRAFSNLWLVGGLVAWVTLVFYVMFKRALLSWALLVAGLIGAWLSIVLLPEIEMGRDRDFGAAELTEGIELLFDPSARGDVQRSVSGGLFVTEIRRPGTLVGVPPELSARVTLRDAVLSNDLGAQVSGEPSFLMRLDRTTPLFPETVGHTAVRARQERASSTLMGGESAELDPFVDRHCTYQTEAEVTLFQPEIVYRLPVGEAGAWRDDYLAIRVEASHVRGRVTYTSRRLRRTCLPQDEEPGYLRAFLVHEHGSLLDAEEVVFVRERPLVRSHLPVLATGLWIGDGHEPLEKIVIPKNPSTREVESLIARIANARGGSKARHLLTLGADHLPAILRAGRASSDVNFRNDCHVVCRRLAQARHRDLIIKFNAIDFDLCGLMMDRGWLGAEALEVMMKEAELNPWKLLPEAWVEAMASSDVQKERVLKILGDRLARSFYPRMSAGFSSGPQLYKILQGIDGFPLDETVRRGWKDYRVRVSRSQTDAPLLKIGLEHGLPGALFMAATLVEGFTEYRGERGLLESDLNGFPSVTRNPLAKTLDPNMFNDDIEDLRMALLNSCDFPPEAQYDELYWIKENASRLIFDKASKKWGLRGR